MGSQPLDPSYALRAENAELRKLTAELRQRAETAEAERADANRALFQMQEAAKDLVRQADEARRERDEIHSAAQEAAGAWMEALADETARHRATDADLAALRRRVEELEKDRDEWQHTAGVNGEELAAALERAEIAERASRAKDLLASPPVAAQGTREDPKQPDAPGREKKPFHYHYDGRTCSDPTCKPVASPEAP